MNECGLVATRATDRFGSKVIVGSQFAAMRQDFDRVRQ